MAECVFQAIHICWRLKQYDPQNRIICLNKVGPVENPMVVVSPSTSIFGSTGLSISKSQLVCLVALFKLYGIV
ncbi:hypothetical protein BDN67DRAFT_386577 [Paxillus ammoniavirescens]|nr:hypothetical protein BDN67DRAFT_386577 [Paxillus ammoniavirescens]